MELIGTVLALMAMPLLLRMGGGRRGGSVVRVRFPLRYRYPRLWWGCVLLGVVFVAVTMLADSYGSGG